MRERERERERERKKYFMIEINIKHTQIYKK